jgi:non-homologous end joining protein Ku
VRSPKSIELPAKTKATAAAVKKFETLIKKKSRKKFSPVEDQETERLLKLVKKKKAKRANVVHVSSEEPMEDNVVDLMQVLKRSLTGR